MTPRLRTMVLDEHRTILVLDRAGETSKAEAAGALQRYAESIGLAGALLFGHSVDLGDDEPVRDGLTIHPDEADALRWAVDKLAGTDRFADNAPRGHVYVLRMLLDRITR